MLITFSGLDGAGKSTLIGWLAKTLELEHGRRVATFHMNDHVGVYAYLRTLRNLIIPSATPSNQLPGDPAATMLGRPQGDGRRDAARRLLRALRYRIIWNKTLRRTLYPFDLFVFLCYRAYHERLRGRILIMDRYFYDTLVDVSDGHRSWITRGLQRLTPTPTVAIYLDITAEESFARKGEYSVEYLRRRRTAYHAVVSWVPGYVVIPTTDIEASKEVVRRTALAHLAVQ